MFEKPKFNAEQEEEGLEQRDASEDVPEQGDGGEKERESLENESRREFLKTLGKGMVILGLGGFEILSGGCAAGKTGLKNQEIHEGLEHFYEKLEDPKEYLRYLREREFVVKNEIFDSYAQTIDKRPKWLSNPVGGYIPESYLDTKEEKKELEKRLAELGLPRKDIKFYKSFFSSADMIIFRESLLKDDFFLKALPHERFHKAIRRLDAKEYKLMRQAVREILERRDKDGLYFVKERYYEGKNTYGFYTAAAAMNWEEFYTYLAQGEFDDSVEQALKSDYPEVYKIFSRIKESCKLKEPAK